MPVSSKRSTEQTPQSNTHQTTKRLRLTMSPSRKRALECTQKRAKGTPSVMELLCKPRRPEPSPPENVTQAVATSELVLEPSEYIRQVIEDISANKLDLRGSPWIVPASPFNEATKINKKRERSGEPPLNADEVLHLVTKPLLFIWAPEKLLPGLRICCPTCSSVASGTRWAQPRLLHDTNGQYQYLATRHLCSVCSATTSSTRKRSEKTFMSDSKEAIRTLPANVAHLWDVTDTGKRLCRNSVVDLVRAMATRTSWSAIAEAINEMKMTAWVKSITIVYLQLCESLGIQPSSVPSAMPEAWRISHKWVRRLFVTGWLQKKEGTC